MLNQLLHAETRVRNIRQEISTLSDLSDPPPVGLRPDLEAASRAGPDADLQEVRAGEQKFPRLRLALRHLLRHLRLAEQDRRCQQQKMSQQKITETQQGIQQLVKQDAKAQALGFVKRPVEELAYVSLDGCAERVRAIQVPVSPHPRLQESRQLRRDECPGGCESIFRAKC